MSTPEPSSVVETHAGLEEGAATVLGRILFEFSRLEMQLGLCLVWVDGGTRVEQLTRRYENANFMDRLNGLREWVETLPSESAPRISYESWLLRTDRARKLRNELVHGRWGIDLSRERVVNVVGLPTSDNRRTVNYSLEDLWGVLVNLQSLRSDLQRLRHESPL